MKARARRVLSPSFEFNSHGHVTEGLYRLFLLCQTVIVALLFWFGVWMMVTFYSPGAGTEFTWRRYSIYCGLIVIGTCLESCALFLGAARKIVFCKTNCFGNISSVCDK